MVWGFLRRRRRAPSVAADISGNYRRTEEEDGRVDEAEEAEEVTGQCPGPTSTSSSLTWDTLKRLRRHASQVVRSPSILPSPTLSRKKQDGDATTVRRRGKRTEEERRRPMSLQPNLEKCSSHYQSTPVLFQLGQSVTAAPSVLRFTSWEKHKSVITLNFDEGDEEEVEEEQEEEVEMEKAVNGVVEKEGCVMRRHGGVWSSDGGSDSFGASYATTYNSGAFFNSSSEANNESLVTMGGFNDIGSGTYYCDSDSGVSSMYESIQRGGNHADASSGEGITDYLDIKHLDPTLQAVLTRAPRLAYSSKILDLTFRLPNTILAEEEELLGTAIKHKKGEEEEEENTSSNYITCQSFCPTERIRTVNEEEKPRKSMMMTGHHRLWGKPEVMDMLGRQREQLEETTGGLRIQLANVERALEEMEALLGRSGPDYRQVRRWRQCVSRIEPLAGLIFGLELRLEEAKEGRQPLEVRLKEAETLGRRQESEVATAEGLVGAWLGVTARLNFRRQVQQRKRLVCELKAVERELKAVEARRKVVSLCPDV